MANEENILNNKNASSPDEYQVYNTFDEMGLKEDILRGIYAHGFEKPSAIQARAIKPIIDGRDTIGQAQSGTGKTGTFAISLLQIIDLSNKNPQGLVILPTRELAMQVATVINSIGSYCNIKVQTCIGGQRVLSDEDNLKQGVHVVVGTPGRIYHMINNGSISLNYMKLLIIDEADVMLEKGFKEQLYEIFNLGFPSTMQIALFSATLTEQTHEIADKFLRNPIKIVVKKEEVNLSGIRQYKVNVVKEEYKFNTLLDLRKFISVSQAFIFCNSKQRVMTLASELADMKQSMAFMHGDMEQAERNKIMEDFRRGNYRILISTDMNARGIDVQQVSLVINYDIPYNRQNYMHRIGRCGRFGRKGVALNFITEKDTASMNEIEEYYQLGIQELPSDLAGIFDV
jgi:translation initiation factor 4A